MKKNIFNTKFLKSVIIFLISFSVFFSFIIRPQEAFAQDTNTDAVPEKISKDIDALSNGGKGLIPCDTFQGSPKCTPKLLLTTVSSLGRVIVYLIVIALVAMIVVSGVGMIYYSDNPKFLIKTKKYIKSSVYALLTVFLVYGLVLGLLSMIGFNVKLLDFLKGAFSYNLPNMHIFPKAFAESIPDLDTGNSSYINFFPSQTLGSLVLLIIKALVNYIAAPALVLAMIWAGFLFVKAQGNAKSLEEAKKFSKIVLKGTILVAAAGLIASTLLSTLNEVSSSLDSSKSATSSDETSTTSAE